MMMRRSLWLLVIALSVVAVVAAACSSSSSSSPTPTPTPFHPIACQVVWITNDPPTQDQTIDYYVIDGPVGNWVADSSAQLSFGAGTSQQGAFEGGFVLRYNLVNGSNQGTAVATTGDFAIGLDPLTGLTINNPIAITDNSSHDYFALTTAGVLGANEGSSGAGTFIGLWSDPDSPDVNAGGGTISILFSGTSFTLGNSLSYALCYVEGTTPLFTPQERIQEAGRRAAKHLHR
jgi:hypothetical protein